MASAHESAREALEVRGDTAPPERREGVAVWERAAGDWRLRFVGRGAEWRAGAPATGAWRRGAGELAWLEQRHGVEIVDARPGACGAADGLLVEGDGIAAVVVTADCVPVALLSASRALLVHAGWRGIAGELPTLAARRLRALGEPAREAWIGPSIGPCCYEVGEDVARAVAATAGEACVRRGDGQRPRLDLRAAVAAQLRVAGVERIHRLDHCTRCRPDWLWSYRRDGAAAGRNLTLLWRAGDDAR